jgi:DedD protein
MDAIAQARLRARRRLIGAATLVFAGLIIFPLLFENKPRPLPAGVVVQVSGQTQESNPASTLQSATGAVRLAPSSLPPAQVQPEAATENPQDSPAEMPSVPAIEMVSDNPAPAASAAMAPRAVPSSPPTKTAPSPATPAAFQFPATGRFVVQVGAFADAKLAQEVRYKLEAAKLRTYTHVINTPDGKRIRVRIGPLSKRDDAEKTLAKVKSLGLGGNILLL